MTLSYNHNRFLLLYGFPVGVHPYHFPSFSVRVSVHTLSSTSVLTCSFFEWIRISLGLLVCVGERMRLFSIPRKVSRCWSMEELARESISLLASASVKPRVDLSSPRLGSLGAIFIMLKSALGAGLLNFPWAFERAGGVHNAITVEMGSLVFLISGLIILGYSSSISGQCTYQAVVKECSGHSGGHLPDHSHHHQVPYDAFCSGSPKPTLQQWLLGIHLQRHPNNLLWFPMPRGIHRHIQQHGEPASLSLGLHLSGYYDDLPHHLLSHRSVIQDPLLSCWRRRGRVVTVEFESRTRYMLTFLWITATLLIALFVPDISKVISVIGGISAFFIFIFPGLCLVFAMQSEPVSWKTRVILTVWGVITLLCGAFIFGQSTTIAVMELLGKV
ncbi:putative sodium-coupled neutral amino acid transporter 8a isoform X6 [Syngnathoides biaculeatus]|uniref:putative sodium-coupled neutral amino acid transporter 8a isoform X6 n=1 Tax=Syngnathoides biaculeatus TaxID=300417 RepID=UPI002ADDA7EB|nr:putative sodium-coupled neutral amino acid transporter 8a isoform X6 [Syngnathoides biaculeatus]